MLLAIDIGNTRIAVGVFKGKEMFTTLGIATNLHCMAGEYAVLLSNMLLYHGVNTSELKGAIICSVVPPVLTTFEDLCQRYLKLSPLVVGSGIKTGVRIALDNPREAGADRIVNAVAAHRLYGGPIIIIDFGTATTFDVIAKDGDYLGGAIAPGMEVAAEALFMRAAQLPRVEMVRPKHVIGKNTVTALQSGMVFGYIGLVEGLIARLREEIEGDAKIIATGGYADIIAREIPLIEVINPDLTLIGLRLIYEMNQR